jgi:hypothetical protein
MYVYDHICLRKFSDRSHREKESTHFMFSKFSPGNCAVDEMMSKNIVEEDKVHKHTHTHTHTHHVISYSFSMATVVTRTRRTVSTLLLLFSGVNNDGITVEVLAATRADL